MSVNALFNYPASSSYNVKVNSCGLNALTAAQISALTPTAGELVYNTTYSILQLYNGGAWITISTATGYPTYSAFRANNNLAQVFTAGTGTVPFQNVDLNIQTGGTGTYNSSTGQFTVATKGVYQFNFGCTFNNNGSNTVNNPIFTIIKNNSIILDTGPSNYIDTIAITTDQYVHLSAVDQCDANDVIEVQITFTSADGGELIVNNNSAYFSGCLINPTP